MANSKQEKRVKKKKKIKTRKELIQGGDKALGSSPSDFGKEFPNTGKTKESANGADVSAGKSKKACKSNKYSLSSNEECKLMHEEEVGPDRTHQNSFGKADISIGLNSMSKKAHKSKKARLSSNKDKPIHKEEDKPKKAYRSKTKDQLLSKGGNRSVHEGVEVEPFEVYEIPSVEQDMSRGMKKWIKEYHDNRPGLKVLQQRIDDFITAYEEQEEQARKEREAQAADGGWTVVVHRKGGKKTTDPESGVAVGSVAQAAVLDKITKKKSKDVGLDFYRFQRREAQRSEIMKLQSKFEEDRKRIQQQRAARKFRPY
ncbi:hypothetical protein Ancab_034338 [Ancistrocladus abbreviatus]